MNETQWMLCHLFTRLTIFGIDLLIVTCIVCVLQVVELLNSAAFQPSEKEKIATLAKVQELIIHLDPQLLDSFFEEVAAFQKDRNADVRKFVVGFIEEAW